jgi:hypothetical protein
VQLETLGSAQKGLGVSMAAVWRSVVMLLPAGGRKGGTQAALRF